MAEVAEEPVVIPPLTEEEIEARRVAFDALFNKEPLNLLKDLSLKQRTDSDLLSNDNYLCGFSSFESIQKIFEITEEACGEIPPGSVFLDVGHGLGHAVVAACLLQGRKLTKTVGLEALTSLQEKSKEMIAMLGSEEFRGELEDKTPLDTLPEILLTPGDFTTELPALLEQHADVSLVFCGSTSFSAEAMQALASSLKPVRDGCILLTLTRQIPDVDSWELLKTAKITLPWGVNTLFVQRRRTAIDP